MFAWFKQVRVLRFKLHNLLADYGSGIYCQAFPFGATSQRKALILRISSLELQSGTLIIKISISPLKNYSFKVLIIDDINSIFTAWIRLRTVGIIGPPISLGRPRVILPSKACSVIRKTLSHWSQQHTWHRPEVARQLGLKQLFARPIARRRHPTDPPRISSTSTPQITKDSSSRQLGSHHTTNHLHAKLDCKNH